MARQCYRKQSRYVIFLVSFLFVNFAKAERFQINRFEPTPSGEKSFFVDRPWYTKDLKVSGGLTFDYAYRPLLRGIAINDQIFTPEQTAIRHQFIGHVDFAASFLGRWMLTASWPVNIVEEGAGKMVTGIDPIQGTPAAGDPRLGFRARVYGDLEKDKFSFHLGIDTWFPTLSSKIHVGESGMRFFPKLIFGGTYQKFSWSSMAGVYVRPDDTLGSGTNTAFNQMGTLLQVGAGFSYQVHSKVSLRFETIGDTILTQPQRFQNGGSHIELTAGVHYRPIKNLQLSFAAGPGFLEGPGSPAFRLITRIAYIPNEDKVPEPKKVPIAKPLCEQKLPDYDEDGVPDVDAQGKVVDQCPREHKNKFGATEDPSRPGCPLFVDSDGDGIPDSVDQCPGKAGDVQNSGCPWPDSDKDGVPDRWDACPMESGEKSDDPKANGCPSKARRCGDRIITKPIYFKTAEDVILKESDPVLEEVLKIMNSDKTLRVSVEGHTDIKGEGKGKYNNQELSERRARSVVIWLIQHGIEKERFIAKGFGSKRPIDTNATIQGRAKNRRVEFIILSE